MSDDQQDPKMEELVADLSRHLGWEPVSQTAEAIVDRYAVPGGWLYGVVHQGVRAVSVTFVPDPAAIVRAITDRTGQVVQPDAPWMKERGPGGGLWIHVELPPESTMAPAVVLCCASKLDPHPDNDGSVQTELWVIVRNDPRAAPSAVKRCLELVVETLQVQLQAHAVNAEGEAQGLEKES